MTIKYKFIKQSGNTKVGPMPTVTASMNSCPDACNLKGNGCYAETGPISWQWKKVGQVGIELSSLVNEIKSIPKRSMWRYGVAGDLPGNGHDVDSNALQQLTKANRGKKGYLYTHYPASDNMSALLEANRNGLTVNLSADNLEQADLYSECELPVVTIVPEDTPKVSYTEGGNKVVVCPAQTQNNLTCQRCELCTKPERDYIIGFRVHGLRKKKAAAVFFTSGSVAA